ncbi:unnamed protein product [Vicia faba]|uniref:Uncharacterized protein n=1 Tax=Vicia faba TaxID=3906 RepID=A0AAV1B182_VICFA|nr:unnamed protein product [Vicia faba]
MNLLKFIGLKRKYCPDYVKAFYYNRVVTPTGIDSRFKYKLVKFDYFDFRKYLDLASSGALLDAAPINYDKVSHVLAISKFVVESPSMSNFSIIQVNFDMCLLHWIVVKILYRKPRNWGRVDDHDLYLMWLLTSNHDMS